MTLHLREMHSFLMVRTAAIFNPSFLLFFHVSLLSYTLQNNSNTQTGQIKTFFNNTKSM